MGTKDSLESDIEVQIMHVTLLQRYLIPGPSSSCKKFGEPAVYSCRAKSHGESFRDSALPLQNPLN